MATERKGKPRRMVGETQQQQQARIARYERDKHALELRKAGATYDQIATQLGYSAKSVAYMAIKSIIKDIIREPAEEVLQLELARLDALLLGVWANAKNGDPQAVDRALRIMERRSAYLGIDAPKKTATDFDASISITDGAHEELLSRIAGLTLAVSAGVSNPEPQSD